MSGCCVNGCSNRYSKDGLKFYRIPRGNRPFQSNRRRLWLQAINRVDWTEGIIKNARICGAHFISGEASLDWQSPDFVPSVFVYTKQIQRPKAKMERYQRESRRDDRVHKSPDQPYPGSDSPEQPESNMEHDPAAAHLTNMVQSRRRCHCSVPCCSNNKQKTPYVSFHDFPVDVEICARWVRAIRGDEGPAFKILRGSTYVCSQHFAPEDLYSTASGRTRIRQGALPSRFLWNDWGRDSQAREPVYLQARNCLGAVGQDDSQEMPDPGNCTEEALPAGAVAKDHNYACHPSPVVPAHVQQMVLIKEEDSEEWKPDVDNLDPESLNIKEEEKEPWTCLERDQLNVKEETDVTRFSVTAVHLKSEDDEEKPLFSQIHQHQVEDRNLATSSSADQMKEATDGEYCRGAETTRNPNLNTHKDDSSSSETELSEDYENDRDVSYADSEMKNFSDCEPKTKDSLSCFKCGKHYVDNRSLQRHMTCHPGIRSSNCFVHMKSDGVNKNVESHTIIQTEPKSFKCDECNKRFTSKKCVKAHMEVHTGDKLFPCDVCGQRLSRKSNLNSHMRIHTGDKPFPCDVCGQKFSHKSSVRSHMRIHTGDKPFPCDVCGQKFSLKCSLNKHMRIHTGEKPFPCSVCGLRFSQKCSLNKHMRTHTGDKPFPCDVCGQKFSQKASLNSHVRIHTGEKLFPCDVCGQRFSRKSHITSHMRVHTGDKPFPCKVCGQRFSHKKSLNSHLRIHTGDKPFPCDICGQRFKEKSYFNSHMRIHTGDKPFPCDFCGQEFRQKSNLNSHMRIHTGDKPFPCDFCGQEFRQKSNLNTHMRIHTGDKPFPCHVCGQRFSHKKSLNAHLRIHTGDG